MRAVRIAVIGFGRVGRRLVSLLGQGALERYGVKAQLVLVADSRGYAYNPRGFSRSQLDELLSVPRGGVSQTSCGRPGRVEDVLGEVEADVVVDVAASRHDTGEPGLSWARISLERGIPFVTADKPPLAHALHKLVELAVERGAWLYYKATVMAGTPLIDLLQYGLAGRRVLRVYGVLNGTTNYVLGLAEQGYELSEAVEKAIEAGYAEPDPTADLQGWDLAAKAAILAQTLGCETTSRDVEVQGVVDEEAAARARVLARQGKRLKYIAYVDARSCKASVQLHEVGPGGPLYYVDGAENAVVIEMEDGSRIAIKGPGAGVEVTAWTLVSDILHAAAGVKPPAILSRRSS